MPSKRPDPFVAVLRSNALLLYRWLQEFDPDADGPIPFPRADIVTDGVRAVARPSAAEFKGRFSLDPLDRTPDKVPDGNALWGKPGKRTGSLVIERHASDLLHAIAAAGKAFGKPGAGVIFSKDERGQVIATVGREPWVVVRITCPDGIELAGEVVKLNARALADFVDGTVDVELHSYGAATPCKVTPQGDAQWVGALMPMQEAV